MIDSSIRIIGPDALSEEVLVLCFGPTHLAVLKARSRNTMSRINSETIQEGMRLLGLDASTLIPLGGSLCTGVLDELGRPELFEQLHKNDCGNLVGCWVWALHTGQWVYFTDGKACYRLSEVGFMVRLDEPRMMLGGTPRAGFGQTMYRGGECGKIIVDPDTNLQQMAARFGLNYPLQ
ncbi:hypothetical protein HY373_01165 [Candidatus Berkelbacteria bacterium]|nr:hypothetical protein [Candidatus Berkelbacteria bacterium]MBI4029770.1 hypothetical protein [Candidatus Berkelbacteria bacterium]